MITIRRARPQDANAIISMHETSIREICFRDYTEEQIGAWANFKLGPDGWVQRMQRDFMWVAEDHELPVGFGHFAVMDEEVGELMGLYLIPSGTGRGIAKKLFQEIILVALNHRLKFIELHSTITAKGFYETLGFTQSSSDTTIEINGVPIPCFPMKLDLTEL